MNSDEKNSIDQCEFRVVARGAKLSFDSVQSVVGELVDALKNRPQGEEKAPNNWRYTTPTKGGSISILWNNSTFATFKLSEDNEYFDVNYRDLFSISQQFQYMLRYTGYDRNFEFTDSRTGAVLPSSEQYLVYPKLFQVAKEFKGILEPLGLSPLYIYTSGYERNGSLGVSNYFVTDKDNKVYLVNNDLMTYFMDKNKSEPSDDFLVQVSNSVNDFTNKANQGLIPRDFYKYQKTGIKIINKTSFDISNIKRKVFIKPFILQLKDVDRENTILDKENHMQLMDKVRSGETLDGAIRRVLKEELQIADDYVGAIIHHIEYDKDKEGNLTPRLFMHIFVNELDEHAQNRKYDWVSLK